MRDKLSTSFWCGFLVHAGLTMAIQDWYGLEHYIQHVRSHWVDLHWLVGVAGASVAIYIYTSIKRSM